MMTKTAVFKSADREVARLVEAKPVNNVWQDVYAYFAEIFREKQALPEITLSTQQLVYDMDARFKKQYNAEMIVKLLQNGFEVQPGLYIFKREDFTPKVRREVVV